MGNDNANSVETWIWDAVHSDRSVKDIAEFKERVQPSLVNFFRV